MKREWIHRFKTFLLSLMIILGCLSIMATGGGGGGSDSSSESSSSSDTSSSSTTDTTAATSTFTVTFDSQSATVAASPTILAVISPATTVVTLPTAPTKTGYTFGGWYTGTNGTGTEFTASSPVTASLTVYAKWVAIPPAVSSITITPKSRAMLGAETQQFTATAYDIDGNVVSGVTFTWSSSDSSIATISSEGLVTAGSTIGTTNITASAGSITSNIAPLMVVTLGWSFSPVVSITKAALANGPSNDVDIVWSCPSGVTECGIGGVAFTRSTDSGANFSTPFFLPNSKMDPSSIKVGPNGNIYVAGNFGGVVGDLWADVALSISTDGGNTFSATPVNVTNNVQSSFGIAAGTMWSAGLAIDQTGNINVVTLLTRSLSDVYADVLYSRSTNGGTFFSGPTVLYDNVSSVGGIAHKADIAASGNNVYVAWVQQDTSANTTATLFMRSTDGGTNFSTAISIGDNPGVPGTVIVGVDGSGVVTVVWEGGDGIYFARSTDDGASFSAAKKIPTTKFADLSPDFAVDSQGTMYVIFNRLPPEAPGLQTDIFFTRSTDGGATFSEPVNISGTFNMNSSLSKIAVDGNGYINLVWWESDYTTSPTKFRVNYRRAK